MLARLNQGDAFPLSFEAAVQLLADAEAATAAAKDQDALVHVRKKGTKGGIDENSWATRLRANDPAFTALTLGGVCIGATGAAELAEGLKANRTVTDLNLDGGRIVDTGASALGVALQCPGHVVAKVTLSSNGIGDAGVSAIAKALVVNSTIRHLDLMHNGIGAHGAGELAAALSHNATLTSLALSGNRIGPEGAGRLGEYLKSTPCAISLLEVAQNSLGAGGAAKLAAAVAANTSVTNLDLYGNSIGPEGASKLAESLKSNSTITQLNLADNLIRADGAARLFAALQLNRAVTRLDVKSNQIGNAGATELAECLKINSTLIRIELAINGIGTEGEERIAQALSARAAGGLPGTRSGLVTGEIVRELSQEPILVHASSLLIPDMPNAPACGQRAEMQTSEAFALNREKSYNKTVVTKTLKDDKPEAGVDLHLDRQWTCEECQRKKIRQPSSWASLGCKWKKSDAVPKGREIINALLTETLRYKVGEVPACRREFTQEEWAVFGIPDLRPDDFVKVQPPSAALEHGGDDTAKDKSNTTDERAAMYFIPVGANLGPDPVVPWCSVCKAVCWACELCTHKRCALHAEQSRTSSDKVHPDLLIAKLRGLHNQEHNSSGRFVLHGMDLDKIAYDHSIESGQIIQQWNPFYQEDKEWFAMKGREATQTEVPDDAPLPLCSRADMHKHN